MTGPREITLRQMAAELRGWTGFADSLKGVVPDVLELLRSGNVKASFVFPAASPFRIQIPQLYWTTKSTDELRSILITTSKNGGYFHLTFVEAVNIFVRYVSASDSTTPISAETILADLNAASTSTRALEPTVCLNALRAYLTANNYTEKPLQRASGSGRRPLDTWPIVLEQIAATILRHSGDRYSLKREALVKEVYDRSVAANKSPAGVPSLASIRAKIKNIYDVSDRT